MQRIMVFIDFENFNISLMTYYNNMGEQSPRVDYRKMPHELIKKLPVSGYVAKTVVCAPKPDDFLMTIESRKRLYNWINGLKNIEYFTVIEGEHIARPVTGYTKEQFDIYNHKAVYKKYKQLEPKSEMRMPKNTPLKSSSTNPRLFISRSI